ncbi:winged helix-turn-helix transcriptional regulator [Tsukamurella ocularis]
MAEYGQFCPVSKTSEILCERWTPLVLRELMCGSVRFGEIARGVPNISTALLTTRLRRLAAAGVITREPTPGGGADYRLTEAGRELAPIIVAMGVWGQRWARSTYSAQDLDPALLMWDIRRYLRAGGLRTSRTVVEFRFTGAPPGRDHYWLVDDGVVDRPVDLCLVPPGFDVDLWVDADLRTLTRVWMGDEAIAGALAEGRITLSGVVALQRAFPDWLGSHPVLAGIAPAD